MKRFLIITTTLLSVILILESFNAFHAMLYFFIAGQIPGTNTYLDGSTMLVICMIPIGFILGRVSVQLSNAVLSMTLPKVQA